MDRSTQVTGEPWNLHEISYRERVQSEQITQCEVVSLEAVELRGRESPAVLDEVVLLVSVEVIEEFAEDVLESPVGAVFAVPAALVGQEELP